jgi:hypothetical protein
MGRTFVKPCALQQHPASCNNYLAHPILATFILQYNYRQLYGSEGISTPPNTHARGTFVSIRSSRIVPVVGGYRTCTCTCTSSKNRTEFHHPSTLMVDRCSSTSTSSSWTTPESKPRRSIVAGVQQSLYTSSSSIMETKSRDRRSLSKTSSSSKSSRSVASRRSSNRRRGAAALRAASTKSLDTIDWLRPTTSGESSLIVSNEVTPTTTTTTTTTAGSGELLLEHEFPKSVVPQTSPSEDSSLPSHTTATASATTTNTTTSIRSPRSSFAPLETTTTRPSPLQRNVSDTPKGSSSRISEIRREMTNTPKRTSRRARASSDEHMQLLQSPRQPPHHIGLAVKPPLTRWHRNPVTKENTSTSTSTSTSTTDTKDTSTASGEAKRGKRTSTTSSRRGNSMRSLLCNKRTLERELNQSNIFHFVLHKCPLEDFQPATLRPRNNRNRNTKTPQDTPDPATATTTKMPLGKFLMMKQISERVVQQHQHQNLHSCPSDDGNDTWRLPSVAFSTTEHPTCRIEEEEEAEAEEEDNDSVVSLYVNDVAEHSYSKKTRRSSNRSSRDDSRTTSCFTEELESQTLSLSLEDMVHPDIDEDEMDDTETATEHVSAFAVADPSGRKGIYSGMISKSSGMPCGHGRLEYHDKGEIFEGQFVHGFWTGYGRCIYTTTGEDYTGCFLDSIKHGHGETSFQDGRVFEGTYSHGIKVQGKMTYQDGSTYLGQWANGARHGRGTYSFPYGSVFFGEFQDDTIHGSGVLTWANGSRYVGTWRDGLRHGLGKEYQPNGSIRREGTWTEGRFLKA